MVVFMEMLGFYRCGWVSRIWFQIWVRLGITGVTVFRDICGQCGNSWVSWAISFEIFNELMSKMHEHHNLKLSTKQKMYICNVPESFSFETYKKIYF